MKFCLRRTVGPRSVTRGPFLSGGWRSQLWGNQCVMMLTLLQVYQVLYSMLKDQKLTGFKHGGGEVH